MGTQIISYRGTKETAAKRHTLWNPGNALAIIQQVAHRYLLLHEHTHSPLPKDVSCMSPQSQNETIGIYIYIYIYAIYIYGICMLYTWYIYSIYI